MNSVPIIRFKGRNGRIELYEEFIRIDRVTIMGFLTQGVKGKKDIYFKNIAAIQIKKPGLTVGYIQFTMPGGIESTGNLSRAVKDGNTIAFSGCKKYQQALKIKQYIENINSLDKDDISKSSDLDEIEKLHSLMLKGIITREEFDQKKKKLLGLD